MCKISVAPGKNFLSGSFRNKISDVIVGGSEEISIYSYGDPRLAVDVPSR